MTVKSSKNIYKYTPLNLKGLHPSTKWKLLNYPVYRYGPSKPKWTEIEWDTPASGVSCG
jgi:hypothetical protein